MPDQQHVRVDLPLLPCGVRRGGPHHKAIGEVARKVRREGQVAHQLIRPLYQISRDGAKLGEGRDVEVGHNALAHVVREREAGWPPSATSARRWAARTRARLQRGTREEAAGCGRDAEHTREVTSRRLTEERDVRRAPSEGPDVPMDPAQAYDDVIHPVHAS